MRLVFVPSFFLVSSYFLTTKFDQNESTNLTYPACFPCTFWELDEIIAFVRAKQYCTTHCLCVTIKASSKVQIDGSSTFSYRFTHSTKFQDILRVFDEFNDFELVYYWNWPRRLGLFSSIYFELTSLRYGKIVFLLIFKRTYCQYTGMIASIIGWNWFFPAFEL